MAGILAGKEPTMLWVRRGELAAAIQRDRANPDYLPGYDLPDGLTATDSLSEALDGADVVVMAVPSHGYRHVLAEAAPSISPEAALVSLAKGIEQATLMRMTEVTADVLPDHDPGRIGVLTGPNLAKEVAAGQPAASVVATADTDLGRRLQDLFMTPRFRVYTNEDVIGCEAAGALKNVMAIAAGMASGLGFGDNTLATVVTRALAEVTRLGCAMGGEERTFSGLAGMGDLVATCVSAQSRNHQVGVALGRGHGIDEITTSMRMVAEGVKSTRGVLDLAERHGVEMPMAEQVGLVLYEGKEPTVALADLMTRQAKPER